ncbi:MAG TPA: hypothetical protein VN886_08875 [Acidimicrobiales bacterium]|nr:hypothetical protein [Acidimicrobiales bacterium]
MTTTAERVKTPPLVQDVSGRWIPTDYVEQLASLRAFMAEDRRVADQLATEDTKEARMRARVLRCRATKGENWLTTFVGWFGRAEPDGPSGLDELKQNEEVLA